MRVEKCLRASVVKMFPRNLERKERRERQTQKERDIEKERKFDLRINTE